MDNKEFELESIAERNAARARTGTDPKVDLPICDKCGWWCSRVGKFANAKCDPKLGQAADALAAQLPGVPATKLGWGHGKIVFEPVAGDANLHVRFDVGRNGRFKLEEVWLLDRMEADAAADLVHAIVAWRKRWGGKRR